MRYLHLTDFHPAAVEDDAEADFHVAGSYYRPLCCYENGLGNL